MDSKRSCKIRYHNDMIGTLVLLGLLKHREEVKGAMNMGMEGNA